jgi:nitrogen PTS system EIIA component
MQLSVSEAAQLFRVSEETIYKWVKEDRLPATRYNDRYRFNQIAVIEWAHHNQIPLSIENGNGLPTLDAVLAAGGVFQNIAGDNKPAVLRELVYKMPLPEKVERDVVLELILARERQGTTAMGNGIAIPHARGPIIMRMSLPMMGLGYLARAVDFGAHDGRQVFALFLLATRTIREHTHLLARLSIALRDQEFMGLVHQHASLDLLWERLRILENRS